MPKPEATISTEQLTNSAKYSQEKGRSAVLIMENGQIIFEEMFFPTGSNPGHGNICWLKKEGGYGLSPIDSAPAGSSGGYIYYNGHSEFVGGLGAGKNGMYLIPSLNIVVIRQT